jgi:TldD protein
MGFDDEGVPAQYTVVIKDGILQSYLHSRETAYSSHNHSTGNARAWLFSREPQVRMTNTYVLPQDMSLEELLQQVNNGLYISGDKKGSADRNGQFAFITTDAQRIEKGEFTEEYFLGPVISGHTQKAFTECTGVGDTKTFVVKPSVCRKGESAFVGSGGPAVATEVVVGGIQ